MEGTDVTCSITSPAAVATTSSRPAVPDRQAFQQALREYNKNINETAQEIDVIVGRNDSVGTLDILKQSRLGPRERREQLKRDTDRMKIEINDIKKQLAEKDALLSDIENDLVYKDESRLTTRLNELESAYSQTKFASNRTEKALIKEIDKLKRNRTKLAKYNIVMEEKRAIQLKLRGMNERRSNVLKSIREITNHLQNTDQEIRQQRRNFLQLKDRLRELCAKKKESVDSYNKQRKEYTDWSNANRNNRCRCMLICSDYSYPATYPAARRQPHDPADIVDDETLEPFYEQKMACKRLIEYLTALQSRMSGECSTSTFAEKVTKQTTADESDDSAEEYPSSFAVLKKQISLPARTVEGYDLEKETSFVNVSKKKIGRKSSKKPCQKICHPVQMICLFKETEVPVPHTYSEIERTLETLRVLLKNYQEQTNTIVWEESDYRKLPSFSESEHTADSAWNGSTDMSERGSTYSFMHVSSSSDLITPVQETPEMAPITNICNQVLENLASMSVSDEGFASKNSTR